MRFIATDGQITLKSIQGLVVLSVYLLVSKYTIKLDCRVKGNLKLRCTKFADMKLAMDSLQPMSESQVCFKVPLSGGK